MGYSNRVTRSGGFPPGRYRITLTRFALTGVGLVFLALVGLLSPRSVLAAIPDTRATLFLGTTTFSAGGATSSGTVFGGSFGFKLVEDTMLSLGGSFSATDGEVIADDGTGTLRNYPVSTSTAEFRVGVTRFFNTSGVVIPYVGGGLSYLNYEIDHTYPGSELGKTSGTAPGLYASAGLEILMTQRSTFILQVGAQSYVLKAENGESVGAVSGGLTFSLRIST